MRGNVAIPELADAMCRTQRNWDRTRCMKTMVAYDPGMPHLMADTDAANQ